MSFKHYRVEEGLSQNTVWCILQDKMGFVWFGTKDGLNRFDGNDFRIFRKSIFEHKNRLGNNFVRSLLEVDSVIWVGTDQGLYIYDPSSEQFSHFNKKALDGEFITTAINSIVQDHDHNLWFASFGQGLFKYDPSNKQLINYQQNTNKLSSLSSNIVWTIYCDSQGDIWVGTINGGLNVFDKQNESFTRFVNTGDPSSLGDKDAISIFQDSRGNLWVGTWADGLKKMNRERGTFEHFRHDPNTNSISSNTVRCILEDDNGRLLIGTEVGLNIYNPNNQIFTLYSHKTANPASLSDNAVYSMLFDTEGGLWAGTYFGGINYSPPPLKRFEHYFPLGTNNSLKGKAISEIIEDDDGNLWLSTNKGLCRYNPDNGEVITYTVSDGLQSNQFNYKSRLKASNGKLYFGGVNGFNAFYPDSISNNSFLPPVIISNFQLFNQNIAVNAEGSILKMSVSKKERIKLKYNQSVIGFEFVALSFVSPNKNHYAYMLEGFENAWNYVNNQRKASYTNLSPGEYVFRVKASNNDGLWNHEGAQLSILIQPPLWKTKAAYSMYFIMLIVSILLVRKRFTRQTLKKHREKLEKMQAEKDKEITKMKFDFFMNIAHEIKTPLTLIHGPLEKLISSDDNKKERMVQYGLIDKNSRQLLVLITQLLDIRKIEDGSFQLKYATFDLNELIKRVYNNFLPVAKEKGITFLFEQSSERHEIIGDASAITNILNNLITNALKFTKSEVAIELSPAATIPGATQAYNIKVKDNGVGIQKSELARIFDPFYQVTNGQNHFKLFPGTGLGLSFVKSLVDLLQGSIEVSSEPGAGSTFKITIPSVSKSIDSFNKDMNELAVDMQLLTQANSIVHFEKSNTRCKQDQNAAHILIVDDNEDLLGFIKTCLHDEHKISTATNGQDALEYLREKPFDLIISDIMMPGMDGSELCRQIRENINLSHIPVILLSAKSTIESKIENLKYGADVFIEKPFSIEHLKAQIISILTNRSIILKKFCTEPFVKASSLAKSMADKRFLDQATEIIENNISDTNFSVEQLAHLLSISRSGLQKKLRAATGLSPNAFIRLIRLKKAASLLADVSMRVNEVCYETGFSSPSYFSKCFHQHFGFLPKDFQNNLNKIKE